MKIEIAEQIVKHCHNEDNPCNSDCPVYGKGCGGGPWSYIEALEVVSSARDQRIAELERERNEWKRQGYHHSDMCAELRSQRNNARRDAVRMAKRCNHIVYGEWSDTDDMADGIIELYGDAE